MACIAPTSMAAALRASMPLPLIATATSWRLVRCLQSSKEIEAQAGTNQNRRRALMKSAHLRMWSLETFRSRSRQGNGRWICRYALRRPLLGLSHDGRDQEITHRIARFRPTDDRGPLDGARGQFFIRHLFLANADFQKAKYAAHQDRHA